jgi:hypothetical protein
MGSLPSNLGWECTFVCIHLVILVRPFPRRVWRVLCKPGFAIVQLPQVNLDAYRVCLFQIPTFGSLLYTSLSLAFGAQGLYSGRKCIEPTVHRPRGVLGRSRTDAGFESSALRLERPEHSRNRHQGYCNILLGHLLLPLFACSYPDVGEGTYPQPSLHSNLPTDLAFQPSLRFLPTV